DYAREILDLEKEAGFDVLPFHYRTLDSLINEAKTGNFCNHSPQTSKQSFASRSQKRLLKRGQMKAKKEVHLDSVAEESKKEQALSNLKNISKIIRMSNFLYSNDPDILFHEALETKKMNSYNCLALYLEIAEKTGLPITAKKSGDHCFIEYELDSEIFGWEPAFGTEQDEKLYQKLEKNKNIIQLDKEKFLGIEYRTIGISLYKKEKCGKAMEYIIKSMNANITEARTNKYEGDVYKCLGKDEKALDSYNYAIKFEENFLEAYIARGEMLYKKGKLSETLEDYNKAIELSPDNPELYKTRGDILIKISENKNKKKAEQDYEKALELILGK
ncbi:MAG: tetratricopeptide repeat protein, partial [Candidatus Daviesbacteria bacterium]|nr:tetratricopeptide repeat protein [Candidatus Daviesbacteria bacterium]